MGPSLVPAFGVHSFNRLIHICSPFLLPDNNGDAARFERRIH